MIVELCFHLIALVETGYGLYYDVMQTKFPITEFNWHHPFGGHFKFLTTQNMAIQALYFFLSILNDIAGSSKIAKPFDLPFIRIIKDYYFASLAFPVALYCTWQFWSLYILNREWVMPQILQPSIPNWLNHVEHTNISILIILEMMICFRAYPPLDVGLCILYLYALTYIVWLHIIWCKAGYWVYPFIETLGMKKRYIFFALIIIMLTIIYLLGELFNNGIWLQNINNLACSK